MRTIHKQQLKMSDRQELTMPAGAKIVHVALQYEEITLWYVFDTRKVGHPDTRTFLIVGTGWDFVEENVEHVGTVITDQGLVWHLFEVMS